MDRSLTRQQRQTSDSRWTGACKHNKYINMFTRARARVRAPTHPPTHTHTHTHTHTRTHARMHMLWNKHALAYKYTHVLTHTHTLTHSHRTNDHHTQPHHAKNGSIGACEGTSCSPAQPCRFVLGTTFLHHQRLKPVSLIMCSQHDHMIMPRSNYAATS